MNTSGDAAEQIVRFSMEGTEIVLRLSGEATKNIAAALYAVMKNKDRKQIKGKTRLENLLKSGEMLNVFTVSRKDLKEFSAQAKRYGIMYYVLDKNGKNQDGMCDLLVRSSDAARINRIVERFKLGVMKESFVERKQTEERDLKSPFMKTEEKSPLSGHFFVQQKNGEKDIYKENQGGESQKKKPSIKKALEEIRKSRKSEQKVLSRPDEDRRLGGKQKTSKGWKRER